MGNVYDSRPWLKLYPAGVPADLPLPEQSCLDAWRDSVRRSPDAPALYYFDTVVSFRTIDALSDGLAVALNEAGVGWGDRVALSLQNVPAALIAQYGAWKCGAAVVPLNPMLRHDELVYQFQDAGAKVLISLESLLDQQVPAARDAGVQLILSASDLDFVGDEVPPMLQHLTHRAVEEVEDLLTVCERHRGKRPPYASLKPEDVAYLVYTSGTTGPPKGAINTHRNVVYNAHVYRVWNDLGPGDVILGGAPLFHITGLIASIAVNAVVGIPIILTYRFEPTEILRRQAQWGGTFTVLAITAYIALLNHPDLPLYPIDTLRKGLSGGAPIPPPVVEAFRERAGVVIHPVYGLTETTSPSHQVPIGTMPPVDPLFGTLAVGLPVSGCESRIVDPETRTVVPSGQTGEIAIKGPMVVPGYWQKPEESARAILDGWLHTGDVGYMDEQGWFYIVDRVKDMIIASGFKIWPREVEEALFAHPAVRETAVIGVSDAYRGETVKAFVSLKHGAAVTPEELITFCRERLAAFKAPRIVEIVDEIPKTATGKLSRRTLREQTRQAEAQH